MALWDIDNLDQAASESKAAGNGKKREWIEGAYHVKLLEFKSGMSRGNPQKGIKPYSKWTIQWLFTEGETAAQQPTVGVKKIQHFIVGHPTKDTSDGAKRDLLLVLKLCGVDLDKLNNEGDLFMAAQGLTQEQPTLVYYIKPQATEGFLDWYPKGTVKADGSVIDKDGNALGKWGLVESNTEAPAAVAQETASDSEDIGL